MDDVKKCGYLRKQKSMRRRFFVLRGPGSRGAARLEYYENEKKFRLGDGSGGPRGTIVLEEAFGVNKRADAKRRHLLVLYTRDGGLCVSTEGEEEQDAWYQAIQELQAQARSFSSSSEDGASWPGPPFREVWQVSLRPRGLGQTRNLSGVYRLCLTERTLSLLRLRCDNPSVTLQLMNVRRCGHSDNYFFVEVGRSAITGPGELWMQVEDSVVAQNMHETILEAMKSLSEEFRPRTKSQSLSSTPITVPSRRHLPNPPPPSQVGLSRRSRAEVPMDSSPAMKPRDQSPHSLEEDEEKLPRSGHPSADYGSASSDEYGSSPGFEPSTYLPPSPLAETNYISMGQLGRRPQTLDLTQPPPNEEHGGRPSKVDNEENYAMMGRSEVRQKGGYMPMLPGGRPSHDYMPMTPNSISPPAPIEMAGYVMMSPLGSCSPERTSWPPLGEMTVGSADSQASDYMNMWSLSRSASNTPPLSQENTLTSTDRPTRIPASYRSLPRSYKMDSVPPSHYSSSSDSLEEGTGGRCRRPLSMSVDTWRPSMLPRNYGRPPSPGEYVSIHYRSKPEKTTSKDDPHQAEYIAMEIHSHAPNGDYTHMAFEPETLPSHVKMAVRPEKKLAAETGKLPKPALEKTPWIPPAMERSSTKTTTENSYWMAANSEKTFRPIDPTGVYGASARVPGDSTIDHMEKTLVVRSCSVDTTLKGLLTGVSGCTLHKGPEQAKFSRTEPPARSRHCSDGAPLTPHNGSRPPVEESGLNYIDLDLAKDAGGATPSAALLGPSVLPPIKSGNLAPAPYINTYASIDFQMSGELRRGSRDETEC
ncbi:insulin receptor substrate 1-like [Bufo bufo]|uniref:insulin receptor substrate 1-like n=1 Tax=Bufo bufo TaxID=8384 RepID=UPI001ABED550|nr:insulin receptor substrate 1-like [Bufo bufo]